LTCKKTFQSKRRKDDVEISADQLWQEYVWGKQTLKQLTSRHSKNIHWLYEKLDSHQVHLNSTIPFKIQPINLVIDFTHLDDNYGALVFRAVNLKVNLLWMIRATEQVQNYLEGVNCLKDKGWQVKSLTLDGKRGSKELFPDLPVQMCQHHQQKIIVRYLTRKPILPANMELLNLAFQLTNLNEELLRKRLVDWKVKWQDFLKEKNYSRKTHEWHFTHQRLRSALRSLETNLPHLFTYQKYPELNIPNTTNCLEGTFAQLKTKLKCHRGARGKRKLKLIKELLIGQKLQTATQKFK